MVGPVRLVRLGATAELRPDEGQHAVGGPARLQVGLEGGEGLRDLPEPPRKLLGLVVVRVEVALRVDRRHPDPQRQGEHGREVGEALAELRRGEGHARRQRIAALVVLGVGRESIGHLLREPARRARRALCRVGPAHRHLAQDAGGGVLRHAPDVAPPEAGVARGGHGGDGRPARAHHGRELVARGEALQRVARRAVAVEPAPEPARRLPVRDESRLPEVAGVEVGEVGVRVVDPGQEADPPALEHPRDAAARAGGERRVHAEPAAEREVAGGPHSLAQVGVAPVLVHPRERVEQVAPAGQEHGDEHGRVGARRRLGARGLEHLPERELRGAVDREAARQAALEHRAPGELGAVEVVAGAVGAHQHTCPSGPAMKSWRSARWVWSARVCSFIQPCERSSPVSM